MELPTLPKQSECPVKFLKKAADFLPVGDIRFLLHQHLNEKDTHRGVDNVHASELTKDELEFCPKFFAIARETNAKLPGRWVNTSEAVTFFLGHSLQDAVVNWFADMGRAVGHWKCLACDKLHEFQKRPLKCLKCGCQAFKPEEVRFMSAVSGASGGIDMLISLGQPLLRIVEIKTMAADQFKGLVAPLAEHRLRTNLYMRLVAESNHPWAKRVDTKTADVLYISKSGYGTAVDDEFKKWGLPEAFSPFKKYPVKRDDKATNDPSIRAKSVKDWHEKKKGMPYGVCETALTSRAKKCPLASKCFSGDYPSKNNWKISI